MKSQIEYLMNAELESPPSRRRGLKYSNILHYLVRLPSPPSRRRGLKFRKIHRFLRDVRVASLAEAWIEIVVDDSIVNNYAGSPPSRRRGLK